MRQKCVMNTLYHYVHCPFCLRVRFACAALKVSYQSVVLSYADELAPLEMTGTKMLPIWKDEKTTLNESLDIINHIDSQKTLRSGLLESPQVQQEINQRLDDLSGPLFKLCMPYFVWTPEFDQNSRSYFLKRKEAKRGPFSKLLGQRSELEKEMQEKLTALESHLGEFYHAEGFSVLDIMIASHLWGLYTVPEFRFSDKLNSYLQKVKQLTGFEYYSDYQKDEFWAPARKE